ncbi:membrane protein [Roseobacter cerasinus]|uniref:Membrane protein n=1 Tax=Roseobacter cerasinus TaxID=2602289 RepID=A0A640VPQ3_9RHOB|nr:hypothetical protein [Roseobacter cerasinus]GFE50223.1 membrane protein [Roseobacter cerasinus]
MHDREFSDAELVAFLDGEAEFAPVAEITAALARDPALQQRLDALAIDRAALRRSFAMVEPEPGVMPDLAIAPVGARAPIWHLATAASLALMIGVGAGAWMAQPEPPGWAEYVAAYQALYSEATLAHVAPDDMTQQVELARVAAAIGKDIALAQLQTVPEAHYKRAQVLSFDGRPLVQLAFTTPAGTPIALCIIRSDSPDAPAPQMTRMEGLSAARWLRDGYDYLLIGGTDSDMVSRMANRFVSMNL